MSKVVQMNQSEAKQGKNGHDPVITDLNMTIATMKMSGMRNCDIAIELGVTGSAVAQHLKRVTDLVSLSADGKINDPINDQRARLTKRLRKTDTIIGKALNYKDKTVAVDQPGHNNLKLATDTALAINKGLHVLTDKQEHTVKVDPLADQRDKMQARLEAAQQFGMEIEAECEIMPDDGHDTNKPEISTKQPANADTASP